MVDCKQHFLQCFRFVLNLDRNPTTLFVLKDTNDANKLNRFDMYASICSSIIFYLSLYWEVALSRHSIKILCNTRVPFEFTL